MSLISIGKMENKNLSNEFKEINASIEKLESKANLIRNLYLENKNNTESYYDKKINIIKDKQFKEISKLREEENKELNKIKEEKEPFKYKKDEILRTFKLNSIKENLNEDIEIKLSTYGEPEPTEKEENLNLMKIGSFIKENNKPINKYDLIIKIFFKNKKLEDFIKINGWENIILEKSFKTIEDTKNYLNKCYDKIVLNYKTLHNEIYEELKELEIKISEEFNFNIIKAYSHQWELKATEKTKAIFINTYDENKKFEVEYLGDNKFKISNEKEKRECELSLEYSVYSLTPEIVIN